MSEPNTIQVPADFQAAWPLSTTVMVIVVHLTGIMPEARRAFWLGMAFERTRGVTDDRSFLCLEITHQGGQTHRVTYATPWDVPVEDVPCSCGAPGAYFIKWEL